MQTNDTDPSSEHPLLSLLKKAKIKRDDASEAMTTASKRRTDLETELPA